MIERANNSNYGLAAGVMSDNLSEANYFVKKLKAGTVYVNCYNYLAPTTPFGGVKDSGMGKDLGE